MQPTFFDYGVLFIVVTSALIGLFRGLIREVLALLGWLFAAWVAYTFSGVAAGWMPESLPGGPVARTILGLALRRCMRGQRRRQGRPVTRRCPMLAMRLASARGSCAPQAHQQR